MITTSISIQALDLLQHLHPVHARHLVVQQDEVHLSPDGLDGPGPVSARNRWPSRRNVSISLGLPFDDEDVQCLRASIPLIVCLQLFRLSSVDDLHRGPGPACFSRGFRRRAPG